MKKITTSGHYTVKETGADVNYNYSFRSFDSLDDALEALGEAKVLSLVQRMEKVDANNVAREKAKVANGHSLRKPMTEEGKAEAKAERQAKTALFNVFKGKSQGELEALGLPADVIEQILG